MLDSIVVIDSKVALVIVFLSVTFLILYVLSTMPQLIKAKPKVFGVARGRIKEKYLTTVKGGVCFLDDGVRYTVNSGLMGELPIAGSQEEIIISYEEVYDAQDFWTGKKTLCKNDKDQILRKVLAVEKA